MIFSENRCPPFGIMLYASTVGSSAASARMMVAVVIACMSSDAPKRCSNAKQTSMCSTESHSGVLSIDESGPRSCSGTLSVCATSAMTAWILGSCIDRSFVDLATIREGGRGYKSVLVVEIGDQLVLPGRNVLADDLAVAALAAELDRLVDQPLLYLAADVAAAGQQRIDAAFGQIDDRQRHRALVAEAVAVVEHQHRVLLAPHEASEVGDVVAAGGEVELVGLLRHLRRPHQLVLHVDLDRAFDAELGQVAVEVEARRHPAARFVGAILLGLGGILGSDGIFAEIAGRHFAQQPVGQLLAAAGERRYRDFGQKARHFLALDRVVVDEHEAIDPEV